VKVVCRPQQFWGAEITWG